MSKLSEKYQQIAPSMTLAIAAKAKEMVKEGINVISFSAGEPDFNTPENIRNVAIARINAGQNGYTQASGIPELKEAICSKLKENGLEYGSNQIVVSNGAKHCISNALLAICNPGDEIILPSPYWVSYYELVKMAGAVPVLVDSDHYNNFRIRTEDIKNAITPRTKAIILNSPNNPTGSVYCRQRLEEIAQLAVENNIYIISDEIYEKLVYGVEHISIASLSPEIYERTIVINGLSKAYAMTGWRIGYSASSPEIAKIMTNIQSHETSNPNTIAQYAAVEALNGSQVAIEDMRSAFERRRNLMISLLEEIDGITFVIPEGAFYVMVDISRTINSNNNIEGSVDFATKLLQEQQTAVIPGIAFGVDQYIRLSYATNEENIIEGIHRIKEFVKTLVLE